MMLVLATIFVPLSQPKLSWAYCPFIEDLNTSTTYAWSTFITEHLVKELDTKHTNPTTVGGCVLGLLVNISSFCRLMSCLLLYLYMCIHFICVSVSVSVLYWYLYLYLFYMCICFLYLYLFYIRILQWKLLCLNAVLALRAYKHNEYATIKRKLSKVYEVGYVWSTRSVRTNTVGIP